MYDYFIVLTAIATYNWVTFENWSFFNTGELISFMGIQPPLENLTPARQKFRLNPKFQPPLLLNPKIIKPPLFTKGG